MRDRPSRDARNSETSGLSSQRVMVNTSRASMNSSLALTLDSPVKSESAGSTASCDSFVLSIDFFDDNNEESFEDPFLAPRYSLRTRAAYPCIEVIRKQTPSRGKSFGKSRRELDPLIQTPETAPLNVSFPDDSDLSFLNISDNSCPQRLTHPLGSVSVPAKANYEEIDNLSIPSTSTSFVREDNASSLQLQDIVHWSNIVASRIQYHGKSHTKVAEAYLELGNAHMNAKEYLTAQRSFQSAYRIFRDVHKPLGVALAMERMGVATMYDARDTDALQRAYTVLLEAFRLRQTELGNWHTDTVDCMNWIAKVHMLSNNLHEAQRCYWQVFWVRRAIYGSDHPSCAVSAHDLANCFIKSSNLNDSKTFYRIAMEIYEKMNLPDENPAVARLLRDMKRMERMELVFAVNQKKKENKSSKRL
jgi:tetratricopeptide (TPR) repeat protein